MLHEDMWFKNLKNPIIALAPMADYTDSPFCRICREVGRKDFIIFREMVSSEALVRGSEKTLKMCEFNEIEQPIVLQVFGSDPDVMAQAVKIINEKFKPDGIDINMGCPVPKITNKSKSGAALMKDPDRAVEIIKKIRVGIDCNQSLRYTPILSVKTRLGWSKEDEILEFAPKLEKAGADLITIHGRTKKQSYSGKANWEMIGRVKKLLPIPVIVNGDINSREDIERCLEVTKADGAMIGRGALGNPWILSNHKSDFKTRLRVLLKHAKYHVDHYGEKGIVTFRKHLAWYFKSKNFPEIKDIKKLRVELMKVESLKDIENILKR